MYFIVKKIGSEPIQVIMNFKLSKEKINTIGYLMLIFEVRLKLLSEILDSS
jgi:hypothetical protein